MKRPDGIVYVDGASLGNPGEGGAGVVLKDPGGRLIFQCGEYLGRVTNNVAEYKALIRGLQEARRRGWERILVLTDSQLVARQVEGTYKVRDQELKRLHEEVKGLLEGFASWEVKHIPRDLNREADRMAKEAAGGAAGQVVAGPKRGQRKVRAPEGRTVANGDCPQ